MVNRRYFIGAGTVASAAAALTAPSIAGARGVMATIAAGIDEPSRAAAVGSLRPRAAIFDERFEAARRFAVAMSHRGVPTHAIRGDVTEVWYTRLQPLWKQAPVPVAGFTAYAAMFCLERLSWDHGLRMIRNDPQGADRSLYSWLIAPPACGTGVSVSDWRSR